MFDWEKYKTDKEMTHKYGVIYDKYFNDIRNSISGSVVEIGSRAGSAELWLDYFPNCSNFVACDILQYDFNHSKFVFFKFNQKTASDAIELIDKYNDISLIIDDGPHTPDAQLTTLQTLIPIMKSDSWIVVEDLHCTEPDDPYYVRNMGDSDISAQLVLKEWSNGIYSKYKYVPNPEKIKDRAFDIYFEKGAISEIVFIHIK